MTGTATLDDPVADPSPPPEGPARSSRLDVAALVVAVASVVGVSLVRVLTLGFVPVAADDAAYIGVGRELWGLREPLGVDGVVYTLRSWVYPLMVGGASRLVGGDPFTGPRVLGWTLATAALALAVVFAFRLARGVGAVAAAIAILAAPVLWATVPSTRVEVALVCSLMVLLLVMDRPSPRRMLVGGVLAGLTLLIKETAAPLVVLPLAYLGTVPRDEWRRLATRYLLGFLVTVAWWFVTVLLVAGEIFPLQGLRQATRRGIPRGFDLNASAQLLIALCIVGWLVVAIGRRHDARARLLVLAGLAFLPAAVIAWQEGFALRQFVPLALLSCIALGVAAADVLAAVVRRVPRGATGFVVGVAIVVGAVAVVPVVLTQDRTSIETSATALDGGLARWIGRQPGKRVVLTTFWLKAELWARLEGDATIRPAVFGNPRHPPALGPQVWVDSTERDYRVMPRRQLAGSLRGTDYLVLTGPHRFGPVALATWLDQHGATVGLTPVAHFTASSGYAWASVYRVHRPRVSAIPTIVTSDAVKRLARDGGFRPAGAMAIAGTRGFLFRYAKHHPPDGPHPYEPLRAPPR